MKRIGLVAVAGWLGLSVAHAEHACSISPITNQGDHIYFRHFDIRLLQGDDPVHPRAWIGPMTIGTSAGPRCKVDASIISPPFFTAGNHYLYVTTYSGSENIQLAVNLKTCDVPWFSPQFVGPPKLVPGARFTYREAPPVTIGTNCLPVAPPKSGQSPIAGTPR